MHCFGVYRFGEVCNRQLLSCPTFRLSTVHRRKALYRLISISSRVVITHRSPSLWVLQLHPGKRRLPITHLRDRHSSSLSSWSSLNRRQWSSHKLSTLSRMFCTSSFHASRSGVVETAFLDSSLSFWRVRKLLDLWG